MPKAKRIPDDDMRPEYDFSNAVRGKYYERFKASTNVVVLDADVSKVFPNAVAVNQALRVLASVVLAKAAVPKRASKGTKRLNKREPSRRS